LWWLLLFTSGHACGEPWCVRARDGWTHNVNTIPPFPSFHTQPNKQKEKTNKKKTNINKYQIKEKEKKRKRKKGREGSSRKREQRTIARWWGFGLVQDHGTAAPHPQWSIFPFSLEGDVMLIGTPACRFCAALPPGGGVHAQGRAYGI
jgi:hypothetical protein